MLKELYKTLSEIRSWAIGPVGFWMTWITMTAAAAICTAWAVGRTLAPKIQRTREGSSNLTVGQRGAARQSVTTLILLAMFLLFYISTILLWQDFVAPDNAVFTQITLAGITLYLKSGDPSGDVSFRLPCKNST